MRLPRAVVRKVDEDGIALWAVGDRVLDVLFDGRRVWSFWSERDTQGEGPARRAARWPPVLRRFLDGRTRVVVREHVSGVVLFDEEVAFGSSADRVAVVDQSGVPMGVDKSGRLGTTFDVRSAEELRPLLDAVDAVLDALRKAGAEPFLAYGTLLGAVREQRLLGHDNDADLGYVSRFSTPVDVVRESFALQRQVAELGFPTHRYSGAAFRVEVIESDGARRGLDVFGGFIDGSPDDGTLYLMGEVEAPYRMDWVYPPSRCVLEGREFPAPARPDRLLEAMYGPSWRVPDPAFKFGTSASTQRKLGGWFRGTAVHRNAWERHHSAGRGRLPERPPTPSAKKVLEYVGRGGRVLDVGAGGGADSIWLARQGAQVSAYDYVPRALRGAVDAAKEEGLAFEARSLNLDEWRSVLAEGARAARMPGPKAVLARHVADATDDFGREALARFASMALRGGGRVYVDVWTGHGVPQPRLTPLKVEQVVAVLEKQGARIVAADEEIRDPRGPRPRFSIGSIVGEWD